MSENTKIVPPLDLFDQLDYAHDAIQGEGGTQVAFKFCCRLWKTSTEREKVESVMDRYNEKHCKPTFDKQGLKRIIDSAYRTVNNAGELAKYRKGHKPTPQPTPQPTPPTPQPTPIRVKPNVAEDEALLGAVIQSADRLNSDDPLAIRMRAKLSARGIGARAIKEFMLGLSDGATLPKWLTIPLFDVESQLQGVITKTFSEPKYRLTATTCLMGASSQRSADTVLLVEGQLDAILLWQWASVPCVTVGSVTHGIDEAGAAWLASRGRVVVAMDNDASGQAVAQKWLKMLPNSVTATPLPHGKDATELWQWGGDGAIIAWLKQNGIKEKHTGGN